MEMGFTDHLKPTENQEKDLKKIQEIYKDITAKNPKNFNPNIFYPNNIFRTYFA